MDAFCYAVDWGTSSFRLWALGADGRVLGERKSRSGMSVLQPAEFEAYLESEIGELGPNGGIPAIVCGMAGAAQGWRQAPYLDVPASVDQIANHSINVEADNREVRILPGLAQRKSNAWDVMRGEETILLGAVLGKGIAGTACLPGTHSKWAQMSGGVINGFSTAMTGELFNLLATKSTLSHFIDQPGGDFSRDDLFLSAVAETIDSPERVLSALFSIRAAPLLQGREGIGSLPARLSGLVIGLEIAGSRPHATEPVALISDGALGNNYAAAFNVAGIKFDVFDSGELTRAGLFHAAKTLWA